MKHHSAFQAWYTKRGNLILYRCRWLFRQTFFSVLELRVFSRHDKKIYLGEKYFLTIAIVFRCCKFIIQDHSTVLTGVLHNFLLIIIFARINFSTQLLQSFSILGFSRTKYMNNKKCLKNKFKNTRILHSHQLITA